MGKLREFIESDRRFEKRTIILDVLNHATGLEKRIDKDVRKYVHEVGEVNDNFLIYVRNRDWHDELYSEVMDRLILEEQILFRKGEIVRRVLSSFRECLMDYAKIVEREKNSGLIARAKSLLFKYI
jgi:hypothetical protein